MDENELEQLALEELQNPSPPATPTPRMIPSTPLPQMSMQDFFGALKTYEEMRQSILNSELMKMQSIEKIINERLQQHIATMGEHSDEGDPIMREAGQVLIDIVKNKMSEPPTMTAPISKPSDASKSEPIQSTTQAENVPQEQNKTEVVDMLSLSDEKIYQIADGIYERFPKDVLAFQKGIITKEQALAKIMAFPGMKQETAERIATALLETEYPEV